MTYPCIEIGWLAFSVFFLLSQAIIAITFTSSPNNVDDAVRHFSGLVGFMGYLWRTSFATLVVIISLTWVHFCSQVPVSAWGVVMSACITLIGGLTFGFSWLIMDRIRHNRFGQDLVPDS